MNSWITPLLIPRIASSSPVAGFRPRRSLLSFTQNFPKPDMSTSSPDFRVRLMISNRVLTASVDSCLEQPLTVATEWIRLDFVYVFDMERTSLFIRGLRVNEPELIVNKHDAWIRVYSLLFCRVRFAPGATRRIPYNTTVHRSARLSSVLSGFPV